MRLLLDTHIFLWWLADDPALATEAKEAIADAGSEVFVSAVTAWEIAIKQTLGRLEFPLAQMSAIIEESGFTPLPIVIDHALRAGRLPPHHHDPFDRMLVAHAQQEGLTMITGDAMIHRYAVAVLGRTG